MIPNKVGAQPTVKVDEQKPEAFLVPHLISFEGKRTSAPAHLVPKLQGTVAWEASLYHDGEEVTDKYGVKHRSVPLFADRAAVSPVDLADVLNTLLWLHRRLPRAYGRPPSVEKTIVAVAQQVGMDVGEFLSERDDNQAAEEI